MDDFILHAEDIPKLLASGVNIFRMKFLHLDVEYTLNAIATGKNNERDVQIFFLTRLSGSNLFHRVVKVKGLTMHIMEEELVCTN